MDLFGRESRGRGHWYNRLALLPTLLLPLDPVGVAQAAQNGPGGIALGQHGMSAHAAVATSATYQEDLPGFVYTSCGDGIIQIPEQCDDGDPVYIPGEHCAASCTFVPCGRPTRPDASIPTSNDALFVFKAAVGLVQCDPLVCDVNSSNSITATDASLVLRAAVGSNAILDCPIPKPAEPTAPTDLSAMAVSPTAVTLEWVDGSTDETAFNIQRKTGLEGEFARIGTVDAEVNTFADFSALPSTTYFYRVRAVNEVGRSTFSNIASATTPDSQPDAPSALTANAVAANRVELRWMDNSPNEIEFKIERRSIDGVYALIASVPEGVNEYSDKTASPLTKYLYRVRAANFAGDSPYSNEAEAVTGALPCPAVGPITDVRSPCSEWSYWYSVYSIELVTHGVTIVVRAWPSGRRLIGEVTGPTKFTFDTFCDGRGVCSPVEDVSIFGSWGGLRDSGRTLWIDFQGSYSEYSYHATTRQ
ncbi:MAG: fibronectin type III domain-containing protein [Candidatus Binatia bacterium]